MSPRVGMIAALVAAVALALSIAVFSWWSGNPSFDGKAFHRKTAHISLITGSQCNYDDVKEEEYGCKHLAVGGSLAITKFIQLGLTGLLVLSLLGLAFASEKKRGFAKLVLITVALSSVMAVVVLAMGPNLKTGKEEAMPLGIPAMVVFFGGTVLALLNGVIAMLPPRRPRVPQMMMMMPAQQPSFDVQALFAEDMLRPAALGPEPMMGRPRSPGGALPGPGPLVPQSGPQPLFQSAPQLRPLYEASASGAFVPPPPVVQFPVRGPTPMPHAAVSAALGLDAPPPPQPPPQPPPPVPAPRLPPPTRTKSLSAAPPIPAIPAPPPKSTRPPPRSPTITSAAVPPPMAPATDDAALSTFEKGLGPSDNTSPNLPPFDTSTSETATREFRQEENTDVGEDIATNAVEKVDAAEVEAPRPPPTEVEVKTEAEPAVAARSSSTVMTSATTPRTPVPIKVPMPARPTNPMKVPSPAATTGSTKIPITTASTTLPPPAETGATGGPSPACPQCEAPMAWVEEHLRFYCKSCRMYF